MPFFSFSVPCMYLWYLGWVLAQLLKWNSRLGLFVASKQVSLYFVPINISSFVLLKRAVSFLSLDLGSDILTFWYRVSILGGSRCIPLTLQLSQKQLVSWLLMSMQEFHIMLLYVRRRTFAFLLTFPMLWVDSCFCRSVSAIVFVVISTMNNSDVRWRQICFTNTKSYLTSSKSKS